MLRALSGYDERLLQEMGQEGQGSLRLANAWSALGIVGCSLSAALLVVLCGGSFLLALTAFLAVLLLTGALQAFGTATVSLSPVDSSSGAQPLHRLGRFVLAAVLSVVCLVFTQPYVLGWAFMTQSPDLPDAKALRAQLEESSRSRQVDQIKRDVTLIQGQLARTDASPVLPASIDGLTPAERVSNNLPTARRKALVIGNNDYRRLSPLQGAVNDAEQMHKILARLGFDVTLVKDADRLTMETALEAYVRTLQPGDVSMFHYSGHGFQSRGSNYLAPIDYVIDPDSMPPAAPAVNLIIEAISRRKPLASIVTLDACRENLAGAAREGLAALEAGANTYIGFAAGPGQLASEITPQKGPSFGLFTSALVRNLSADVDVDQMFRLVRTEVLAQSTKIDPSSPQETWTQHNLTAPIVLASGASRIRKPGPKVTPQGGEDAVQASLRAQAERLPPVALSSGNLICDVLPRNSSLTDDIAATLYVRCLKANLLRLRDDLKELESGSKATASDSSHAEGEPTIAQLAPSDPRSAMLAFRAAWSEPAVPLVFSIILLAAMSGGFFWRAMLATVHEAYAERLHGVNRDCVVQSAERAWSAAVQFPFSPGEDVLRKRILARLGSAAETNLPQGTEEGLVAFVRGDAVPSQQDPVPV